MEPDFSKAPPPRADAAFASDTATAAPQDESLAAGVARHLAGDLAGARALYTRVLALDARNFDALHLLGQATLQCGDAARAAALIGAALEVNPFDPAAHYNHGVAYGVLGQLEAALSAYDACLGYDPSHAEAYSNRGIILWSLKRPQAAVDSFDKAIALNPRHAGAFNNRGIALRDLKQHAAALASYETAIALNPADPAVHNNRGVTLDDLGRTEEALAAFARATALSPDYAEAHTNRGLALFKLRRYGEALAAHDEVIRLNPQRAEAFLNRGVVLAQMKRPQAALAAYDNALRLNPDRLYLYGTRLHLKMLICDWTNFDGEVAALCTRIARGERATASFEVLALTDAPLLHRKAAEIWTADKHPPNAALGALPRYSGHAKIRVGYFSMDFRDHPVSSLTVGMYEAHDRNGFEIYGFSYGEDTGDPMRKRLERAFDRFMDVRAKSDLETAALARELEIDIAIDLAGYTDNGRSGIFAARAAPVQVSYLGYLGTMGADYIDYVVADATVIPEASRAAFSEKVAVLPSYQVNDAGRPMPDKVFTRAELGLPPEGFVYCCFNNTYKITPATFDSWMRILGAVEGSVLFLYADVESAAANLRKEAAARGIAAERLVFGKRLPMPEYLARFRAADLFLDTLPYNAGATASDALWMGLPVLTLQGEALAARQAASLLRAAGLAELITTTRAAYEALAIGLARDPVRHAELKAKLARNRPTAALFDTGAFTRNIEEAFRQMHGRHQAGLAPDHIVVEQSAGEKRA